MKTIFEYMPVLRPLVHLMAHETEFKCEPPLREVFAEHPRLIIALSHSTPLSWLPSAALLAVEAKRAGGGHRRPIGVMDKFFFQVPLLREVARAITQTRRPLTFFELCDRFERGETLDVVMFPEGSNCFFGAPDEIQEFRSNKFIELALLTQTPLLIGAHVGSEAWARALEVPREWMSKLNLLPRFAFDFIEKRLKKTGLLVLPLLPTPMSKFQLRCELYHPVLRASELVQDPVERASQLRQEGERVRTRLRAMLEEMNFDHAVDRSRTTMVVSDDSPSASADAASEPREISSSPSSERTPKSSPDGMMSNLNNL